MPVVINVDTTIVTSDLSMCEAVTSGGDFCVLAGTDITVNTYLRATGSRPLVLIASGSITTTPHGLIDVGSHRVRFQHVPEVGAGADPPAARLASSQTVAAVAQGEALLLAGVSVEWAAAAATAALLGLRLLPSAGSVVAAPDKMATAPPATKASQAMAAAPCT